MKSLYEIIVKDKETKNSPALSTYLYTKDEPVEFLSTNVISLNLLFNGRINGGIPIGKISMISAPSMLGKSSVAYGLAKNAQKRGMQVCIIDTERAFNFEYANRMGINTDSSKLVVLQENSVEEVTGIIVTICNEVPREVRKNILFIIDSWGSMVTSKTLKDAESGNDVADMTVAKKKNSLANIMINTRATFFVVNHVYDNTGGMGDPLKIPGGQKILFNSDSVVLGKSRAKDKNSSGDILGHIVTAETHKSRFSKEKSKLHFRIKHNGGLDVFYGILDDALECGVVTKPVQGKYTRLCVEKDKNWHEKNIYCSEFWLPIFKQTNFSKWLEEKYTFDKQELDIVKNEEYLDEIINKKLGE